MIFFFILFLVCAATIILISLFAPHKLPWYRPHLIIHSHPEIHSAKEPPQKQPVIMEGLGEPDTETVLDITSQEKLAKLEAILLEKNILIDKLQKQITAEKSHRLEFEKIQNVMNEEIQNLRSLNKALKIRIGEEND